MGHQMPTAAGLSSAEAVSGGRPVAPHGAGVAAVQPGAALRDAPRVRGAGA